ncbi:hypothetical protein SAMN05660479_02209 [Microbulbifer thermotolerans]|nr:hypothetical protein SAMN05660479_02209 [Microbulbifer thermotolerans]
MKSRREMGQFYKFGADSLITEERMKLAKRPMSSRWHDRCAAPSGNGLKSLCLSRLVTVKMLWAR